MSKNILHNIISIVEKEVDGYDPLGEWHPIKDIKDPFSLRENIFHQVHYEFVILESG